MRTPLRARVRIALGIILTLGLYIAAWAQAAPRPPAPAASVTATDPAYVNGYRAGYQAGAHDRAAAQAFNFHKFLAYQEALAGYQSSAGSRADYQASFRSGFQDGYGDAYQGRRPSVGSAAGQETQASPAPGPGPAATQAPGPGPAVTQAPATGPAAAPAPAAPPGVYGPTPAPSPATPAAVTLTPQQQRARAIGYREGYSAGQFDSDRGAANAPLASREYRQASAGYSANLGNFADFQQEFRDGFVLGYGDGFNHRLYNSAIGLRTRSSAAIAPIRNNNLVLPAGTVIHGLLDSYLSTKSSHKGDAFSLTVNIPVYAGNGAVAIPSGSRIEGTLATVKRGGFLGGSAELMLDYQRIILPGGHNYALVASTTGVSRRTARTNGEGGVGQPNKKGQDVRHIGVEAGTLGVLGGIFGGMRGIATGVIAGTILGTGGVIASRKRDIRLYTGDHVELKLNKPLSLEPIAAGI